MCCRTKCVVDLIGVPKNVKSCGSMENPSQDVIHRNVGGQVIPLKIFAGK